MSNGLEIVFYLEFDVDFADTIVLALTDDSTLVYPTFSMGLG